MFTTRIRKPIKLCMECGGTPFSGHSRNCNIGANARVKNISPLPRLPTANVYLLSFQAFEQLYVKAHGKCKTKKQLTAFFNLANSLGLRK